jgi:hypothetical protein
MVKERPEEESMPAHPFPQPDRKQRKQSSPPTSRKGNGIIASAKLSSNQSPGRNQSMKAMKSKSKGTTESKIATNTVQTLKVSHATNGKRNVQPNTNSKGMNL